MRTPRVFVSYSQSDRMWVRDFADSLRKQDVEVWVDECEIELGDSIREKIELGLRQSDAIVAVVSRSNAHNPNVFFELGIALGMRKRLIPIVSADLGAASIPFDLRVRRYVRMGTPEDAARQVAVALMSSTDNDERGDL